ncbi:MAG: LysM peptidoglycan-binding domain-containing protein [bacterium]|nr:LysM peptidoglycan-binding domain-containing protein [bacterium]
MPQHLTIDYKKLTIDSLHNKFLSFLLGISLFLGIILISINIFVNYSYLIFTKPNSTSTKNTAPKKNISYIVQEGDDLWKISEQFYGSGFNANDIAIFNKLSDANTVSTGQKLLIPVVNPKTATQGDTSSIATSQVTFTGDKYTVKADDDLSNIALQAYGDNTMWTRIAQANNLVDPNNIKENDVLIIPR